ncbi:MAG: serine hydrolase [Oscillospiraceae bacterium]|nr:serine hydrolase [Oscillospiraceae bacterium]
MVDVNELRSFFEKEVEVWDHPSMAVGIVKDGEVILNDAFGYADVENKRKADADTMYMIGSCSKAFTAACAALLVDRGLLEWDRPVHDYIPWLRFKDDFVTLNATTRDMLCHRTGLPRHDVSWIKGERNRKETVENLKNMIPGWSFRSHWNYQNVCIVTVGYLIEVLTGMTWEEFVQKEILDPLGMTRTTFWIDAMTADPNHAEPYGRPHPHVIKGLKKQEFLRGGTEDYEKRIGNEIGPAGSIVSTVNDMLKWVQFNLNNGKVGDKQLISEENMKEIHSPQMLMEPLLIPLPETDFYSYGMGWFTETFRGHRLAEHGGNITGFSALVTLLKDQNLGSVILVNNNGARNTYSSSYHIMDQFLGITDGNWSERFLEWQKKTQEAAGSQMEKLFGKPVEGTVPSHPLEAYTGVYHNECYGDITVTLEDGDLFMDFHHESSVLKHFHYDCFQLGSEESLLYEFVLQFLTEQKGKVDRIKFGIGLDPSLPDEIFTKVEEKKADEEKADE